MTERERLTAEILNFDEQTYFEMNQAVASSVAPMALGFDFEGLILSAPGAIPVQQRDSLPTLFVAVESGQRAEDVPLGANAVVVAANADTGEFHYAEAFPEDPSKSPGGDDEGDDEEENSVVSDEPPLSAADVALMQELGADRTASGVWLDYRELLQIPWEYGRYGLWVIAYDQISNPAYVRLVAEPDSVDGYPAHEALALVRDTSSPGMAEEELPSFEASGATPALQGNGVAVAVGEMTFEGKNSVLPIHASMRLPIPEEQIVTQHVESGAGAPAADRLPSAVVTTTLLLTNRNMNPPLSASVAIPVWADHELRKGEIVEAAFSLDLQRELRLKLQPGTYYLYLFGGAYVSAPQRIEVVAAP